MSAKKSFKIGECAVGGIIQVELKGKLLSVKALDYNSKREVQSGSILTDEYNAYWKTMNYLNELTSSYYADKIMKFIESKTELNNRSNFL